MDSYLKQGGLGAVPPEALGCLVFELPKIYVLSTFHSLAIYTNEM